MLQDAIAFQPEPIFAPIVTFPTIKGVGKVTKGCLIICQKCKLSPKQNQKTKVSTAACKDGSGPTQVSCIQPGQGTQARCQHPHAEAAANPIADLVDEASIIWCHKG